MIQKSAKSDSVADVPNCLFRIGNEKLAAKSASHKTKVANDRASPLTRLGKISDKITQVTAPKLAEKPAMTIIKTAVPGSSQKTGTENKWSPQSMTRPLPRNLPAAIFYVLLYQPAKWPPR